MSFLRRRIRVQIQLIGDTFDGGADSLELEGLRARATVQATVGGATSFQGQAQIRLNGMRGEDMAKLSTLGLTAGLYQKNLITILAGDDVAGMSQIFSGSIYAAYVDYNSMPDVGVEISAAQTAQIQQAPIAASSYKGALAVATMLQGIAANAGLSFVNAGVTAVLSNHAVGGSASAQISDICQAANVSYDIRDNTLTIWPAGGMRDDEIIEVSAQQGMIGYPMYTAQGIDVVTEFNPNVVLGRRMSVITSIPAPTRTDGVANPAGVPVIGANGTFYIFDVSHEISSETPGGPWQTRARLGTVNTQARAS